MEIEKSFKKAQSILEEGGVIAIPTETVYGLAARVDRIEGIQKIFSIKGRPTSNPLIVHIYEYNQIVSLAAHWPPFAKVFSQKFWPGPLTIIVQKKESLSMQVTGGLPTVALRMPSHPVARELLKRVGVPLAAPSANISTKTSPTCAEHVRKDLPHVFILEAEAAQFGLESTVIRIDGEQIVLLRSGVITKEDLEEALRERGFFISIIEEENSHFSPGTSLTHYQPDKPLFCFDVRDVPDARIDALLLQAGEKTLLSPKNAKEMKLHKDPFVTARMIYRDMHRFSEYKDTDFFFVIRTPNMEGGVWEAIWDRLQKASTYTYKA